MPFGEVQKLKKAEKSVGWRADRQWQWTVKSFKYCSVFRSYSSGWPSQILKKTNLQKVADSEKLVLFFGHMCDFIFF